jgi:hypothetical protein
MTRNGKIARLPRGVREELNGRLENGEPGVGLVEWLNGLPAVQQVLREQFGGRPINEQNLSEWKGGGYRDWQEQQEKRVMLRQLTEEAGELTEAAGGLEASRGLVPVLTAELALAAREGLQELTDPKERRRWLLEALAALARLRREEHLAGNLVVQQERWEREKAEAKSWGAKFKEIPPPWVMGNPPESNPIKPDQTESKRKKNNWGT